MDRLLALRQCRPTLLAMRRDVTRRDATRFSRPARGFAVNRIRVLGEQRLARSETDMHSCCRRKWKPRAQCRRSFS